MERSGRINHADSYIRKWISPETRSSHPWISYLKVENFKHDFRSIFGQFLDMNLISDGELEQKENISNSSDIKVDIDRIIAENLDVIYGSCPLWSELESMVYGTILSR
jgi:hypothetical protein